MKCSKCGSEVPEGTKFCPNCGNPLNNQINSTWPSAPKKKHSVGKTFLIVLLIFFVLGIFSAAMNKGNKDTKAEETTVPVTTTAKATEKETTAASKSEELYKITYQNMHIYKDSLKKNSCDAMVEIQNISSDDIYIDGSNKFDIMDESNKISANVNMLSADPRIVAPGEKGYIYINLGTELNDDIDPTKTYTLVPHLDIVKAKIKDQRYDIKDDKMTESSFGPDIVGTITNNTDKDDSMIWIAYVLYDESGTPLQCGGTNVMDVKAGQSTGFENKIFLNDGIDKSKIKSYKLFAEPSTLHQY